ncbi:hypothetical protein G718_04903 [Escherichia coli HVH 43 (4-2173468)]|nr:hypothetical protein G718_04903 [Escherichia coli HVH 43 (4-2173468)]
MKNNRLYIAALVTFVLLVASFSLDSYILDMADNHLLFLLSGLIFLCLIPIVLVSNYMKTIKPHLSEKDYCLFGLFRIPFVAILLFSFIRRFIPEFHVHPIMFCLIMILEYVICILTAYVFVRKMLSVIKFK